MEKKVAIIILTYNQENLLKKCLDSLRNTSYSNYKIFLVDDNSKSNIGKKIKKDYKDVNVIINKKNFGFSKSNNIGIKTALNNYHPDYVLLLNDDTEIVQKDWLKKMISVGESNNKIGVLGCRIIYPNGRLQNIGGRMNRWTISKILRAKKSEIIDVDHVMGAFMLIKKQVIQKIGLLDEIYSPYLLEDTDYCLRAKENGFLIKSVSYVKIVHKKGKTIDSLHSKKSMYIRFKNDIVFSLRHLTLKNAVFRIFVYLPLVAVFVKKSDEDTMKLKNIKPRNNFLLNILFIWTAFAFAIANANKIKPKNLLNIYQNLNK